VVAAYRGGSPDVFLSYSRIDGFEAELRKYPEIVFHETIESLAATVDAVMILSVDGRTHLEQAKRVFPTGKPVFIDKPLAGNLRDAIEIMALAKRLGVPCFSTSSRRYSPSLEPVLTAKVGQLQGALSYGPAMIEPNHPDLYFYGIHAVEGLYTAIGTGCQTVVRTHTEDTEVVTGVWADGRFGTVVGQRNAKSGYGLTLYGTEAVVHETAQMTYVPMLRDILTFFRNGKPPVPADVTLEIMAFMEAADESKRRGGQPVSIAEVMKLHSP
jgi:predicted dehydrogenase